jgi:hypothetical protein
MKFLFDIVHPAHVHFFKHVMTSLQRRGHELRIVAREKDVTNALLDRLGFAHETVGRSERKGLLSQGRELLRRDLALARVAREFAPDVPDDISSFRACAYHRGRGGSPTRASPRTDVDSHSLTSRSTPQSRSPTSIDGWPSQICAC